jgi:hypothetical protein
MSFSILYTIKGTVPKATGTVGTYHNKIYSVSDIKQEYPIIEKIETKIDDFKKQLKNNNIDLEKYYLNTIHVEKCNAPIKIELANNQGYIFNFCINQELEIVSYDEFLYNREKNDIIKVTL